MEQYNMLIILTGEGQNKGRKTSQHCNYCALQYNVAYFLPSGR